MATHKRDKPSSRCLDACFIIGCWLLVLPNNTRWVWGNMTVYVSSYLYAQGGHSEGDVNTPWLISIYSISWTFGVFLSGFMTKKAGRVVTLFSGMFINVLSVVFAFVSVRCNSIYGLNFSFGWLGGISIGMINAIIILIVAEWAGNRQGLMNSLVFSSINLSAMPFSLFVTRYLNPLNLTPRLVIGSSTFFTQTSVLEKTPNIFLFCLLAIVFFETVGLILIGHKLFSCHGKHKNDVTKWWSRLSISCCCCLGYADEHSELFDSSSVESGISSGSKVNNSTEITELSPLEERISSDIIDDNKSTAGSEKRWVQNGKSKTSERSPLDKLEESRVEDADEDDVEMSFTPRQLLRTPSFYILCLVYGFGDTARVWMLNYYKYFGLLYIPDDYFLTDLGTAMAVVSTVSRFIWGWSLDYLGIKTNMIICSSTLSVSFAFFFFTPLGSRWMYLVAALFLGWLVQGYSILLPVATYKLFGKAYFGVNFGMVCLVSCFTDLTAPLTFRVFLANFGWFPLLIAISLINAVAVGIISIFMPQKAQNKKI